MILYGATLPSYNPDKNKGKPGDNEKINADDPQNKDIIRKLLFRK